MEIVRKARDLQLSQELWLLWIRQIDGKEGIRVAEGDQVEDVVQEAGALNFLSGSKARKAPHQDHVPVKDIDPAGYACICPSGHGGPEVPV